MPWSHADEELDEDGGSSGDEMALCVEKVDTGEYGVLRYNMDLGCDEFWICMAEDNGDDPSTDCWFLRHRMRGRHLMRRRQGRSKGKGGLNEMGGPYDQSQGEPQQQPQAQQEHWTWDWDYGWYPSGSNYGYGLGGANSLQTENANGSCGGREPGN